MFIFLFIFILKWKYICLERLKYALQETTAAGKIGKNRSMINTNISAVVATEWSLVKVYT